MVSKSNPNHITHHISYIKIIPHPKATFQASTTHTYHLIKVKLSLPIKLNELALRWRKEWKNETLGPICKLSLTPKIVLHHPHHLNPKSQHKTHQNLKKRTLLWSFGKFPWRETKIEDERQKRKVSYL